MHEKKLLTTVFAILLTLLLIPTVSATIDFSLTSKNNALASCSCSLIVDELTLSNTGNEPDFYRLQNTGKTKDWALLNADRLFLRPGEKTTIFNHLNLPCTKSGEYENRITVTSERSNVQKTLSQPVIIEQCPNIKFSAKNQLFKAFPGVTIPIELTIENTREFTESYTVDVEPLKDFITFTQNPLIIAPHSSKTIIAYIELPYNLYGLYDFTFVAATANTKYIARLPIQVEILQEYNYTINAQEQNVCNEFFTKKALTITNDAYGENIYEFVVDTDWTYLFNNSITLQPQESKQVFFEIDGQRASVGKHTVRLTAKSVYGDIEQVIELPVSITDCFDLQIDVPKKETVVSCTQNYQSTVVLKNSGSQFSTWDFFISGDLESTATNQTISLDSNEQAFAQINVNIPCDVTGKKELVLDIKSQDVPAQTYQEKIIIDVESPKKYHKLNIEFEKSTTNYSRQELLMLLENQGYETTTYDLALIAPDWITLEKDFVTLQAGEKFGVNLISNPAKFENISAGWYRVTLLAKVSGKDMTFSKNVIVRLKEKTLLEQLKGFGSQNIFYFSAGIIMLAALLAIIYFYRIAIKPCVNWTIKNHKKILFTIALIAVIGVVLLLVFSQQTFLQDLTIKPTFNKTAMAQVASQTNTSLTLAIASTIILFLLFVRLILELRRVDRNKYKILSIASLALIVLALMLAYYIFSSDKSISTVLKEQSNFMITGLILLVVLIGFFEFVRRINTKKPMLKDFGDDEFIVPKPKKKTLRKKIVKKIITKKTAKKKVVKKKAAKKKKVKKKKIQSYY
ncbi:MFS transporter [Candidatus Woesearchaeota archaeon]|nr:MFS transporter [Candidatus Woesearchaeota archaeon]